MRRSLLVAGLLLGACSGPASDLPSIQDSATGEPRTRISLNRILQGRYRAIAPACVGQQYRIDPGAAAGSQVVPTGGLPMRPGDVVEFRNYLPDVPANVTALAAPAPMYSPNLVRPYNLGEETGEEYSYWRYELPLPGVYEFFDTNLGEPGRRVVDSYYGTVTFVGESSAPKGVVCVDAPGCTASLACLAGSAPAGTACCLCPGVCCTTDSDCSSAHACLRGRCVDPAE
jgi:hypothetical protein